MSDIHTKDSKPGHGFRVYAGCHSIWCIQGSVSPGRSERPRAGRLPSLIDLLDCEDTLRVGRPLNEPGLRSHPKSGSVTGRLLLRGKRDPWLPSLPQVSRGTTLRDPRLNSPLHPLLSLSVMLPNIRFVMRIRPLLLIEAQDQCVVTQARTGTYVTILDPHEPSRGLYFNFHTVYGPQTSQDDIWRGEMQGLMGSLWKGQVGAPWVAAAPSVVRLFTLASFRASLSAHTEKSLQANPTPFKAHARIQE